MQNSPTIAGFPQSNGGKIAESWKKLKTSNMFSSFRAYLVLGNNSLFVGQLYKDESLLLHARDLIFFTTDLQTHSTIHC